MTEEQLRSLSAWMQEQEKINRVVAQEFCENSRVLTLEERVQRLEKRLALPSAKAAGFLARPEGR